MEEEKLTLEESLKKFIKESKMSIIDKVEDAQTDLEKVIILEQTYNVMIEQVEAFMKICDFAQTLRSDINNKNKALGERNNLMGMVEVGLFTKMDENNNIIADPDSPCFEQIDWDALEIPFVKRLANKLIEKLQDKIDSEQLLNREITSDDINLIDWSKF
ncbi:hypothetical protein vipetofem_107 [Enterococcus phage vipetofem]|uniref:Uncharacterized protein n=1 Tax=Enterococcus phage vipetofem TaxID=2719594 RepID=A0A6G9LL99_9CAUD|nr:hypothetical protein KNU92_gp033 [Enterococcus phage vipetofem]QIQ66405.1 hypothetical protein vipetofem_107 [Enterococcus phage vipetofem]SCZ83975.1 hypothetical protein [Enterococcus phage VFW]